MTDLLNPLASLAQLTDAQTRSISAELVLIPPKFIVSSARPKAWKYPPASWHISSPWRLSNSPVGPVGVPS